MFEIIGWVVLGMLIAIAVRVVLPVKDPDGLLSAVLLGIAGALLGALLSIASGVVAWGESTALIAALVGAVAAVGLKTCAVRRENRTQ